MGKTSCFLVVITIISVGSGIAAAHAEWSRFTSVVVLLLLLVALIAAGVLAVHSGVDTPKKKRRLGI